MAKKGEKKTRKKVKVMGTMPYIDPTTGEVQYFNMARIEERDFNFHKVWLSTIINQLDEMTNKKTKVAFYLIENMRKSDNTVTTNITEVSRVLGISRPTVQEAFKVLLESDFMRKMNANTYMINANTMVAGGKQKRDFILLQFDNIDNPHMLADRAKETELQKLQTKRLKELEKSSRKELLSILNITTENPLTLEMSNTELISYILKKEFKENV